MLDATRRRIKGQRVLCDVVRPPDGRYHTQKHMATYFITPVTAQSKQPQKELPQMFPLAFPRFLFYEVGGREWEDRLQKLKILITLFHKPSHNNPRSDI